MPLRAIKFPFPLFVGTDICQIARIRKILERAKNRELFVRRVLQRDERAKIDSILSRLREVEDKHEGGTAGSRTDGQANGSFSPERARLLDKAANYMAGRFAAKEAIIKAHPHLPKLSFKQIYIFTEPAGAPAAVVEGGGRPAQEARISISHDGDYATAVCLGFEHTQAGEDGSSRAAEPAVSSETGSAPSSGGREQRPLAKSVASRDCTGDEPTS